MAYRRVQAARAASLSRLEDVVAPAVPLEGATPDLCAGDPQDSQLERIGAGKTRCLRWRVMPSPLIERGGEQDRIRAGVAAAVAGRGEFHLIEGTAGIGKSSLLADARDHAVGLDVEVALARCSPLEREFPFGVAVQLLVPLLSRSSEAERSALLAGPARAAAPILDPRSGGTPSAADTESFAYIDALYWLTVELSDSSPLLLAVDDAQWADDGSLRYLHFLAQRLAEHPICLLLTIRTGEASEEEGPLTRLRGHPAARLIEPPPLSARGSSELVRRKLPDADDAFCLACRDATAGNPFYLCELVDAAAGAKLEPTRSGADRLVELSPIRVSRSILTRLATMPARMRELAVAVAVVGDGVDLGIAAALADLDPVDAGLAADGLVSAELLGPEEPLRFAHPLIREIIYSDTPSTRRGELHRRAAELLVREGAPPERIAAQLLRAPAREDAWARDALRVAAERSLSHAAPADAARILRRALQERPFGEERGELLALTGIAEAKAGEGIGTERLAEAAALIDSPRRRAAARFDLAFYLSLAGRHPDAAEHAERGLEELGGADRVLERRLRALAAISGFYADLTDPEAAAAAVRTSIGEARLEGDAAGRALLGSASVALGFGEADAEEVQRLAQRALSDAEPGDDPLELAGMQLACLALVATGDFESAEVVATTIIDAARRRGSMVELGATSQLRSMARFHQARVLEALPDAEISVEAGRWGWGTTLPMAHAQLAFVLLERDEGERAATALELPGGEQRWAVNVSYGYFLIARAAVWADQGEVDAALEEVLRAGELSELVNVRHPAFSPWRGLATRLLWERGELDRALELAAEDLDRARRFGAPAPIGAALRTLGMLTGGSEGIAVLREAEHSLRGTSARLEHVRAQVELGAALRRGGHRREAREPLRAALDAATRGGATVLANRALDELHATGAKPRRRQLSGVEALTPSERRVAELAADGLSNREIAQHLFVSRKTVENHLGNVYSKLDLSSRSQLPAALSDPAARA